MTLPAAYLRALVAVLISAEQPAGLAATGAAGPVHGYGFQRMKDIAIPWVAHALSGVMFLAIGAGAFLPTTP